MRWSLCKEEGYATKLSRGAFPSQRTEGGGLAWRGRKRLMRMLKRLEEGFPHIQNNQWVPANVCPLAVHPSVCPKKVSLIVFSFQPTIPFLWPWSIHRDVKHDQVLNLKDRQFFMRKTSLSIALDYYSSCPCFRCFSLFLSTFVWRFLPGNSSASSLWMCGVGVLLKSCEHSRTEASSAEADRNLTALSPYCCCCCCWWAAVF